MNRTAFVVVLSPACKDACRNLWASMLLCKTLWLRSYAAGRSTDQIWQRLSSRQRPRTLTTTKHELARTEGHNRATMQEGLLAAALKADWSTDQANTNPSASFAIGPAIWAIPKVHLRAAPDDVCAARTHCSWILLRLHWWHSDFHRVTRSRRTHAETSVCLRTMSGRRRTAGWCHVQARADEQGQVKQASIRTRRAVKGRRARTRQGVKKGPRTKQAVQGRRVKD